MSAGAIRVITPANHTCREIDLADATHRLWQGKLRMVARTAPEHLLLMPAAALASECSAQELRFIAGLTEICAVSVEPADPVAYAELNTVAELLRTAAVARTDFCGRPHRDFMSFVHSREEPA